MLPFCFPPNPNQMQQGLQRHHAQVRSRQDEAQFTKTNGKDTQILTTHLHAYSEIPEDASKAMGTSTLLPKESIHGDKCG